MDRKRFHYCRAVINRKIACLVVLLLVAGCSGSSSSGSHKHDASTLPSLSDSQIHGQNDKLQATIRRTSYGVPHITADSLEDMGFGVGYAQAKDNICLMADQILRARSERARFLGPGPNNINIIKDFSYKALGILSGAKKEFPKLSARSKAILRGFAAGYNKYLNDTGVENLTDPRCSGKPWVRPIKPQDVFAYLRIEALLASGDLFTTGATFFAAPPGVSASPMMASAKQKQSEPSKRMLASLNEYRETHEGQGLKQLAVKAGSNGWAIGSKLTESGRGAVMANPHLPMSGNLRFREFQVTVPGVIDAYGVGRVMSPTPQIGFNKSLAWTHTRSASHRFALYKLTLAAGNTLSYVKDGKTKPITSKTFRIKVSNGSGGTYTLKKKFYYSEYGPMLDAKYVNKALPEWGDTAQRHRVAFSYRDAALPADKKIVDQWLGMARAKNLSQFRSVFQSCGTTFYTNTMYADREGNAFYMDSSLTPNLTKQSIDALRTRLQNNPVSAAAFSRGLLILDGSTSRDDWIEGKCGYGTVPASQAPKLLRHDFVQNSNDSYWATNPTKLLSGYSPLYGPVDQPLTLRTRMGLRMLLHPKKTGSANMAPAGADGLFSARDLMSHMLYSNRTLFGETAGVRKALNMRCDAIGRKPVNLPDGGTRSVADGCAAIAGWDGLTNIDSTGAYTFLAFIAHYQKRLPKAFSVAFDPNKPVTTPRDPARPSGDLADDPMLQALAQALEQLDAADIAYDEPLGDVQVYQQSVGVPPGGTAEPKGQRIPWPGGSNIEGAFNVAEVITSHVAPGSRFPRVAPKDTFKNSEDLSKKPGEGYLIGRGATWQSAVEFTGDGPKAFGLLTYSESSNSASPHASDQEPLYSKKHFRKLLFDKSAIDSDPEMTKTTITESLPGSDE